jgi:hypothetical protein
MVDVRAANRSFTTIDPSYAGGGPVTFSSGGAARWVLIKTNSDSCEDHAACRSLIAAFFLLLLLLLMIVCLLPNLLVAAVVWSGC